MEEDILNYLPTVMFRGTRCILQKIIFLLPRLKNIYSPPPSFNIIFPRHPLLKIEPGKSRYLSLIQHHDIRRKSFHQQQFGPFDHNFIYFKHILLFFTALSAYKFSMKLRQLRILYKIFKGPFEKFLRSYINIYYSFTWPSNKMV